ncbi:Fe2+-dependent dioxygenase [Teredinibacter turnerae]|uniref:Fe2+-dependent dioxygenase n=1 Tax=Teredinibacter turnerae TaxID=2426 RepID=UPI00035E3680|nr:Fe2+-dependent dioxygenase [Teredinibacter turnerae]
MLIVIDALLAEAEVLKWRARLEDAEWLDGRGTGGTLSAAVKSNLQLPDTSELAINLGNTIVQKLGVHPLFLSAALPEKIYPPKFNCYRNGGAYGTHVDSAIMVMPNKQSLRTDISATLFLSDPDSYDGGELEIETAFGAQAVKLNAGDLVLYPSSSLHRVTPVTRGQRVASFIWIQSMVPDEAERALLFDLDQSIQSLISEKPADDPTLLRLTSVYHNLLRRYAKV